MRDHKTVAELVSGLEILAGIVFFLALGCKRAPAPPSVNAPPIASAAKDASDPGGLHPADSRKSVTPRGAEGTFRVKRYVFGNISSATEEETKSMVGKTLTVLNDRMTFDGRTCEITGFKVRSFEDYLEEFRTEPGDLKIAATKISDIQVDCSVTLAQIDAKTMLINRGGDFLVLERAE